MIIRCCEYVITHMVLRGDVAYFLSCRIMLVEVPLSLIIT